MTINQVKVKGVTLLFAFRSATRINSRSMKEKLDAFKNLCRVYETNFYEKKTALDELSQLAGSFLNISSFSDVNLPPNKPKKQHLDQKFRSMLDELNGVELNYFVRDILKGEFLIEDVHIRFEDDETHKHKQFAAGLSLQVINFSSN